MQQQYTAGDERNRMLDILQRLHQADADELADLEARDAESEEDAADSAQPVLSDELMQKLTLRVSILFTIARHA